MPGEGHMGPLYLSPIVIALDVQVQADQAEGNTDGFALRVGVLDGVRIHHVLMNERGVTPRERVRGEVVEGFFFGVHREYGPD